MSITVASKDGTIFEALRSARNEIQPVEKGKENFFGGKYMELDAIKDAVDPILEKWHLYITQWPDTTDSGEPALTTLLVHNTGETLAATAALTLSKKDPQAQGSAITYMKRYAYVSILGIKGVDVDDDGNRASLPNSQIDTQGQRVESGASREVVRLRRELETAAKGAGLSNARLTKQYHDEFGKDYKQDTDEGNLAVAIAKVAK